MAYGSLEEARAQIRQLPSRPRTWSSLWTAPGWAFGSGSAVAELGERDAFVLAMSISGSPYGLRARAITTRGVDEIRSQPLSSLGGETTKSEAT